MEGSLVKGIKMMEIGAQLYTIRDFCQTQEDLSESLKKIADIGYKNIQISGICKCDPNWLKTESEKNGLKIVLSHTNGELLKNKMEKVLEAHTILGTKYIGLGSFDFKDCTTEKLTNFKNQYTSVMEKIYEDDKYFMYHNHDKEFQKVDGKLIIDHLIDNFSADKLGFTLDTFWVQAGGADPAFYLEKLKGRVPCIHIKDFAYGRKFAVIGEGNINFDRVFEKAEYAGTKYLLVEQDDCYGENPFDCLKRSFHNLKSMGFYA